MESMTLPPEPQIIINGTELTTGQAMAVRVAVSNYYCDLYGDPNLLGDDDMGRAMVKAYLIRLEEIIQFMK